MPQGNNTVVLSRNALILKSVMDNYVANLPDAEKRSMVDNPEHPTLKALETLYNKLDSHDLRLLAHATWDPELQFTPIHTTADTVLNKFVYDYMELCLVIAMGYDLFVEGQIGSALMKALAAIVLERIEAAFTVVTSGDLPSLFTNLVAHAALSPAITIPLNTIHSVRCIADNTKEFVKSNLLFLTRPFGGFFGYSEPAPRPLVTALRSQLEKTSGAPRLDT